MSKVRLQMQQTGNKILEQTRTDLFMSMRFLSVALGSLGFQLDVSTRTIGTDAEFIRYNPTYLLQQYIERPEEMNRMYMHMLLHCIFRHMFSAKKFEEEELWDICCDIAVESVLDSMDYPCIYRVSSDFRQEWYERLAAELPVLSAEQIYHYFQIRKLDPYVEESLRQEFGVCDHGFWERLQREEEPGGGSAVGGQSAESSSGGAGSNLKQQPGADGNEGQNPGGEGSADAASEQNPGAEGSEDPNAPTENPGDSNAPKANSGDHSDADSNSTQNDSAIPQTPLGSMEQKEEEWKEHAKRIESDMEMYAKDASKDTGSLQWMLQIQNRRRRSYQEFLRKLAVVREEVTVDMDSFDYGFYMYGLEHYGNMPLIEENEYRETRKVEELVIAIDTSASCRTKLVQQFLNETGAILREQESFHHKINVHIIECDNQVQRDIVITDLEQMEQYMDKFEVSGGYGTDFRPVFSYVEDLRKSGQLQNLRGLMYFTDGFGDYPKVPTSYDTVFVYYGEDPRGDRECPDWAMKLYIDAGNRE